MNDSPHSPDNTFNRDLVAKLATASHNEARARRRWSVFFRAVFLIYLIVVTALYFTGAGQRDGGGGYGGMGGGEKYAAVIQIYGAITADGDNNATLINSLLRQAFKDDNAAGVILEINSPGGSAVESNRIYNEIRRLREKHPGKPLVAVAGDFCASGGYYIAAAADNIYADPASIIGSIGVIFSGFGLVDTMEKLGVERRVQTAGGSKNLFDPFSPQTEDGRRIMDNILNDVHATFKQAVQDGRGERLADDYRIYNGTVFSGADSMALGLIDGFNDTGGVARDVMDVESVRYYRQQDWLSDIVGRFAGALAAAVGAGATGISGGGVGVQTISVNR